MRYELVCVIAIAWLIAFLGITIAIYSPYSPYTCDPELWQRVQNTKKACEWCEEFLKSYNGSWDDLAKKYGVYPAYCMGATTCAACVEFYKAYHNLSEFPYYCWRSDESPPC